jgi:hypothetical protein
MDPMESLQEDGVEFPSESHSVPGNQADAGEAPPEPFGFPGQVSIGKGFGAVIHRKGVRVPFQSQGEEGRIQTGIDLGGGQPRARARPRMRP